MGWGQTRNKFDTRFLRSCLMGSPGKSNEGNPVILPTKDFRNANSGTGKWEGARRLSINRTMGLDLGTAKATKKIRVIQQYSHD